jgi:hypothetical protein
VIPLANGARRRDVREPSTQGAVRPMRIDAETARVFISP